MSNFPSNWAKYVPIINGIDEEAVVNEENSFTALKKLEKQLRPAGLGAKQPTLVSLHKVCLLQ